MCHKIRSTQSIRRIFKGLGIALLIVLSLFFLLGLIPQSSREMASQPDPATSYADAVARYQEIAQAESAVVNNAGGSHLLVHGQKTPRAYVLVHGITNSPLQWLELGQVLHEKGHNVLITRMPYHGLQSGQVGELKRLTAEDLRAYADQAADISAGLGDEVVVAGISGGGAIAAWMAVNRPEVDRALLLAPFFGIHGVPGFANTLLMNAFSRLPNLDFDNPDEPRREWVYRGEATRGVAAFLTLGQQVQRQAADGIVPHGEIILITTEVDDTANNDSTASLVERWQQDDVPVTAFEFPAEEAIPHNSVDPAADPVRNDLVVEKMLMLMGE